MKLLNMICHNESVKVVIDGKKITKTHTNKTTLVPCIRTYSGKKGSVLGNRVVRRIIHRKLTLIEYKPVLRLECAN